MKILHFCQTLFNDYKQRRFAIILISVIVLSYLSSCSGKQAEEASLPTCAITAPLDSLLYSIFPSDNEPGCVLAVMRGDSIVYERCRGIANLDSMNAITVNTDFNLSSSSKLFSSVALLKLIEEGKLNLDDTLDNFFPELPEKIFNKITIRHLLTQTSGIPDLRPCTPDEWARFTSVNVSVFGDIDTYRLYGRSNEYIKVFTQLEHSLFEPGTHYLQNDPCFMLIAPLIERLTGTSFESWMTQNVFLPAGTPEIFYYQPGHKYKNLAHGYRPTDTNNTRPVPHSADGKWEEADYGEIEFFLTRADRGAHASPRMFLHFLNSLYSGKVISKSSLAKMMHIYYDSEVPHTHLGLGNVIFTKPGFPMKRYHSHNNGGFRIIEATWPEADVSYVLFANRNNWNARKAAEQIDEIIKSKGWLDRVKP